jgi:hypothetical protein
MLIDCKSVSFYEFAVNVYGSYPGLFTWTVNSLAPPGVTRIWNTTSVMYLREVVGLKHVDTTPVDVQPNPPKITDAICDIISDMEDIE